MAPALAALPLLVYYGWTPTTLLQALVRAQARGEELLLAWSAEDLRPARPVGLAWFVSRGGLGRAGYLKLLAVLPEAAGRGVGRALLQSFEQATAGAPGGQLVLCAANNAPARAFYRRLGYMEVGTLPGFVLPNQQEVLLHRPQLRP